MTSIGKLNERLIAEQLMEPPQAKTYHVFTQDDEREWSNKRDLSISEPSFGQKRVSTQSNDYPPIDLPIRDFYGKNKQSTENSFEKQLQKWEERPQPKCKQLEILAKLYKDQDRYTGDNDSFDYKLLIFYDLCRQACVQHEYYAEALTHMLNEKSKDIYLDSVLGKP
ncbi:hypothetical protein HI914_00038 [Erysiphe necator]|nr:hypothetical protein HI914_00038 [Erysiphe necator]